MNRKSMILVVLLLAIGFAAISTTLYINGSSKINPNQEDFNVYYSDAYVNEAQDLSVITDDTHISFTTTFEELGQKYILDYEVTNGSKNYDAELIMSCTSSSEYLTVLNEFDTENILMARGSRLGRLSIEQTKSYAGDDLEVTIECIINANALERDSLNEDEIQSAGEYVIEGYYVDENNNPLANKNLVIFSETPHYVTTDETGYVFYNGLERGKHEVYYLENELSEIKQMSKTEIKEVALGSATFNTRNNEEISFTNNSIIINVSFEESVKFCESIINKEWTFSYIGSAQTFVSRCDGTYKMELWGAQGAIVPFDDVDRSSYSNGGYVKGNIEVSKNKNLYVYIGEEGKLNLTATFNGGGRGGYGVIPGYGSNGNPGYTNPAGYYSTTANQGTSGGGATDIRLVKSSWNNFDSLKSRIIVAAGGGGDGGYNYSGQNSSSGGLNGYKGNYHSGHGDTSSYGKGATQTSGGGAGKNVYNGSGTTAAGTFGIGGNSYNYSSGRGSGGGGGGYYGGGAGGATGAGGSGHGAGGGSSFISGHTGCNAIAETSTSSAIKHTGSSEHYSGYIFTDTKMVDGQGYNWTTSKGSYTGMPSHDGTTTIKGNQGNGYAKITYLG